MLKSGHRIVPVVGREQEKQVKDFKEQSVGMVRLQPGGWFYMLPFIEFTDKIFEYKFKPTDTIVMTYPKSGTTWTQEIVWTLQNNPDLNNPDANAPVDIRVPFINADCFLRHLEIPLVPGNELYDRFTASCPGKKIEDGLFLQLLDSLEDPRVIKTHFPFSLLMPNLLDTCKVIYLARDPKDVVVSYHHHMRVFKSKLHGFVGTMDDLINHFVNDTILWGPYWKHIEEAWKQRSHPNLHFMFYEDMKNDPKAEVLRIQEFIGTNLTNEQIDKIVEYTSFSEMKKRDNAFGKMASENVADNPFLDMKIVKEEGGAFFRKGVAGDWKTKLTTEQVKKIEEWTEKHTQSFGPDFKYRGKPQKN